MKRRCQCGNWIVHPDDPDPQPEHICRDCSHDLCEYCCNKRKEEKPRPVITETNTMDCPLGKPNADADI